MNTGIYRENDRVQLKHLETGKLTTITVRWWDSRTGFLSLPDYEYYRVEENAPWQTPEWKIVQKMKRLKKKKKGTRKTGPRKSSRNS